MSTPLIKCPFSFRCVVRGLHRDKSGGSVTRGRRVLWRTVGALRVPMGQWCEAQPARVEHA